MAVVAIARNRTTVATDTAITVTFVCELPGWSTEQPSGFKESITTGHVVSTCSSVEATMMGGVEATQEVRRVDRSSLPGSAV